MTKAMTDSVSVIIPTYNVAATVERAINSVLQQTHAPHEIICIDDCSTDNTLSLLETLASQHPQIKVLQADRNRGPSHARNLGLDTATGNWVAILDGDDAWRPERLGRMLEAAHAHTADVVFDNLILHDAASGDDVRLAYQLPQPEEWLSASHFWNTCRFASGFPFSVLKMLTSRRFIELHNIRYNESLRIGEDLLFYATLLEKGARVRLLNDGYYQYTTPTGILSGQPNTASATRRDFLSIVPEIDRFLVQYRDMAPETRAAAKKCRNSFLVSGRADALRERRAQGDLQSFLLGVLQPSMLAHLITVRVRIAKARRRERQLRKDRYR